MAATVEITCDVVIVGAGSSGSVVAERLSADQQCRVVVIESGCSLASLGVQSLIRDGFTLPIGVGSPLVQRYQTILTDDPRRTGDIVRGSVVGGSGAVNGGYFCRALATDYAAFPAPEWSWAQVNSHYRAIDTDQDFLDQCDGGPIPVSRVREFRGVSADFIHACVNAGISWVPDINRPDSVHSAADKVECRTTSIVGAVPLNIADNVRVGPAMAFLEPAMCSGNVQLITETRVNKILLVGGKARGVHAVGPHGSVRCYADQVVLAAGALGSAQILMLSGMGPPEVLRAAGIRTEVALPVGVRCWDHPEWVMPASWHTTSGCPVLETVMFTDSCEIRPYTRGFQAMTGQYAQCDPVHVGVALLHPQARGQVRVVSADPDEPLRIEHHYDAYPADLAALRQGCELITDVLASTTRLAEPLWSTSQHLCGSAPMGKDNDPYAVVDPQCRVWGVPGLWVIDGSVLPNSISRGPHATITMLGHRAAQFVRSCLDD